MHIQDRLENSEALGKKRKTRLPVSEVSRKFSGSRNNIWKVTADLLYEVPQTLSIGCYEAPWTLWSWGNLAPCLLLVALSTLMENEKAANTLEMMINLSK